jgi:predicted unusual protein kinase regulating ubiquinone biosynthesis (AarF/ABC1/UbiB family)
MGINRILSRVSEAYGRMMLYEGLFQADGHPGNILVMKGACGSAITLLYRCCSQATCVWPASGTEARALSSELIQQLRA